MDASCSSRQHRKCLVSMACLTDPAGIARRHRAGTRPETCQWSQPGSLCDLYALFCFCLPSLESLSSESDGRRKGFPLATLFTLYQFPVCCNFYFLFFTHSYVFTNSCNLCFWKINNPKHQI